MHASQRSFLFDSNHFQYYNFLELYSFFPLQKWRLQAFFLAHPLYVKWFKMSDADKNESFNFWRQRRKRILNVHNKSVIVVMWCDSVISISGISCVSDFICSHDEHGVLSFVAFWIVSKLIAAAVTGNMIFFSLYISELIHAPQALHKKEACANAGTDAHCNQCATVIVTVASTPTILISWLTMP